MDKNVIKQIILGQQELISRITLQPRPLSIEENGNYVFVGIRIEAIPVWKWLTE